MRILLAVLTAIALSAPAQTLQVHGYTTTGHPTEALETPDGQYVLVTVDTAQHASGIDVFRVTPKKLERMAFQPLGSEPAQGIVLIPRTHTLAVGVSNSGVAFLPLEDTLRGKAKAMALPQGDRSGSGYLAATPDGRFLFVANEYGDRGNLGVIALHPDAAGQVHPEPLAHIPTPSATPGVTVSPDGSRVYAVGEVIEPQAAAQLPGRGVPELERSGCVQASASRSMPNGVLYVIDVAAAAALTAASSPQDARQAVLARVDSGCSPVRVAVSPDGATLYVTARGDNRVLVFDARALETDPGHALRQAIPTGGEAPVGLHLFADGKALLVANSNRFAGGPGNAAVIDLSDAAKSTVRQTVKTGEFPRNITQSADGARLYLTIFLGNELLVLQPQ
jgi:DNA-binding beta-propeller fold protein YncE